MEGDYDLIGRSIQDQVAEPIRSKLFPGFDQAKAAALTAQAPGCGISGSGPSIFALAKGEEHASLVGNAMQTVYKGLGIDSTVFKSPINPKGPRIIENG